jgi:hypothetical protein
MLYVLWVARATIEGGACREWIQRGQRACQGDSRRREELVTGVQDRSGLSEQSSASARRVETFVPAKEALAQR